MAHTSRPPEAYEIEAYQVGLVFGEKRQFKATVTRREVYLDELGRPVKLVEEQIETTEDI